MEVESRLYFDDAQNSSWAFDDISGEFPVRKKKLTDHWRRFIRPLIWRCKWVELQIKEIQPAQAQKYDRQLAEFAERPLFDFVEGIETKSLPFSSCTQRTKVMKRKNRKEVEETADLTSYMLQHNLFSYYENTKSAAACVFMNDDSINQDKALNAVDLLGLQEEEWPSFDSKGDDNIHENSLRKIELLKSQARKLKACVEKLERENPGKFASVYEMTMRETDDVSINSDQDHASPRESRDRTTAKSKAMKGVLPESAVSSHGEVVPVSDLNESTSQPQTGEENLEDKEVVKEEIQDFANYESHLVEKRQEVVENRTSKGEMPMETIAARVNFGGKTLPKNRTYVTYTKRNCTTRKSSNSGWSRKR